MLGDVAGGFGGRANLMMRLLKGVEGGGDDDGEDHAGETEDGMRDAAEDSDKICFASTACAVLLNSTKPTAGPVPYHDHQNQTYARRKTGDTHLHDCSR